MIEAFQNRLGLKYPDIPRSLAYWVGKKQKRPIALIKPSAIQVVSQIAQAVSLAELRDFVMTARLNWMTNAVYWILEHESEGCKFCNPESSPIEHPNIFDTSRTTRLGEKMRVEERLIVERMRQVLRYHQSMLGGKQVHDLLVPYRLVPSIIRAIFEAVARGDFSLDPISKLDYMSNFRNSFRVPEDISEEFLEKRALVASLFINNRPDIEA